MLLARTSRQADFSERERMIVGSLMPALEALTRRNERLEERLKQQPFIESLFELTQSPTIALDPRGGFLWASERADALLKISSGGRKNVPEVLVKAARQLGELIVKRSNFSIPPVAVAISQKDGIFIRADLHLARTRSGTHFIVAELENPGVSPRLAEIAARYRLTKTETQVFKLISAGLSDREISRRLFISPATVHSHVNHILAKLGVHSRVQAALVAHGIKPS
jgi:DNA-binding CsgD family transcriptional regulator